MYLIYPLELFNKPWKISTIFIYMESLKVVPEFQREPIVELYFDTYKGTV